MAAEKITVRTKKAAEILDVSEIWLKKDRRKQNPVGPPAIKRGRMVLYRIADLKAWTDEGRK